MSHYDVIIIGAGTWGGSTAWQLAERGHRVLAIDAFHPPHDHGSHAGATRLARQSNSTGPEYLGLTQQAFDMWDRIGARTQTEVLVKTGNVFVGRPGSKWFDNTLANLQGSQFEHEILTGAEGQARFPRIRIADDEVVVWEPNGSVSQVQPSIRAIQQLGREAGVQVRYDEPVRHWTADESGVTVTTDAGSYTADRLVITGGAFTEKLLNTTLPTQVERQVLANFRINDAAGLPSVYFAPPPGDDSAPGYGCPEPDGTYKLSVPGRGNVIDPSSLSQDVTAEDLSRIVSLAHDRLPELDGDPISTTVCMWTESQDGHWLIGRHPAHSRVVVGAGCNGRGFRYAPVVGSLLADLTEGTEHPELALFDFNRFDTPTTAG
jgi:sarcosine oxidase